MGRGIFFLGFTVFPFIYGLMLSIRTIESIAANPGALIPPLESTHVETYVEVLTSVQDGGQGFLVFLRNSAIIATVAVIVSRWSRSRVRTRSPASASSAAQVSALFLAVYLFPAILLAIPLFVIFTRLGLRGSLVGLMIVYASQTVPITIYMLKQYFDTVPASLEEAASMEGLNRLQILRHVSVPLAAPAIMATSLFVFMIAWNEFLFALLFLVEKRETWTVSLGLSQLAGSIEVPTTVLMAGAVILTVPIVIVFFVSERFLVGGLTAGAEKG